MHPQKDFQGGLSQIKNRVIKELATAAGAQKCYVWVGRTLKEIEMISLDLLSQDEQTNIE